MPPGLAGAASGAARRAAVRSAAPQAPPCGLAGAVRRPRRRAPPRSRSARASATEGYRRVPPRLALARYIAAMRLQRSADASQPLSLSFCSAGDAPELRKNPTLYAGAAADATPPLAAPPAGSAAQPPQRKPQVLAPAGGWPQLRAAIACGADAVYFGTDGFNARARAENFTLAELPAVRAPYILAIAARLRVLTCARYPFCLLQVMAELHAHGVLGFVALNILIFDDELASAEARVRAIAAAGVDAVIVQDIGVAALVKRCAPALPLHASTQMSVTSAEGARFAAALGAKRVVAARELSVRELRSVAAGAPAGVELEAFVHGALCVSYSGQCLSSEAWGGRSANRGQCAQACRLPYQMLVDGQLRALADVSYLLSPQDLCGLAQVGEMIAAGVQCFKIEGRLKGPEYVAATTSAYRAAVDAAWAAGAGGDGDVAAMSAACAPDAGTLRDLAQVFARGQDGEHGGLTPGFLAGVRHQQLVRGRAPRHRGVLLGTVRAVTPRGVRVALAGAGVAARRGVGVVFDAGKPAEREEGGAVYDVYDAATGRRLDAGEEATTGEVELTFGRGDVDGRRVAPGQMVWRSSDPVLEAKLRKAATAAPEKTRRSSDAPRVRVAVSGAAGQPLTLTLTAEGDAALSRSADTSSSLQPATARAVSAADVAREVGTLAAAGLQLAGGAAVDTSALGAGLFLPAGEMKRARAAAAAALAADLAAAAPPLPRRDAGMPPQAVLPPFLAAARAALAHGHDSAPDATSSAGPALRVLCRTPAQVSAALELPWLTEVALDFLEVQGLAAQVRAVQASGRVAVVATPRVLKPDEERLILFYLKLGADALLVRSIGLLHQLTAIASGAAPMPAGLPAGSKLPALHGDFSLNAANTLSSALLLNGVSSLSNDAASSMPTRGGALERLTPAHDLSGVQLAALARSVGPAAASRLEVVIHQHLPVFHTEHCLYARHLSDGNSYQDCGHPCERHTLTLRGPDGADNPVLADMGCRNTVFGGAAQGAAALPAAQLRALLSAGVGGARVELLEESAADVAPLLSAYRRLLAAATSADDGALAAAAAAVDAVSQGRGGLQAGSLQARVEQKREHMKPTAAAGKRPAGTPAR